MEWIDDIITGLKDMYEGLSLTDVIKALGIEIIRTHKEDRVLLNQDALYVRCLNDLEIIYIQRRSRGNGAVCARSRTGTCDLTSGSR